MPWARSIRPAKDVFMNSRLSPMNWVGVLISWAMPEASWPMTSSFWACWSWASSWRCSRCRAASCTSRWMAGTRRARRSLSTKSLAPARSAVTASSSPRAPEMRMQGRSGYLALSSCTISMPLAPGNW